MFKVVLDTNVILAAYLTKGTASKIVKKWAEGFFELLASEEIIKEYLRILLSQDIDPTLVFKFNDQLNKYAKLILPRKKITIVYKDPDDDKFFECATEGGAKYIVSNDKHLLEIRKYNGIKILTAQQFLKMLGNE